MANREIESVKLWINAFIPKDIPGYTKAVPGHDNLTMIPGPAPYSDCYYTSQRSFSDDIHASSKMHSEVRIGLARANTAYRVASQSQYHSIDETVECDCEDGGEECRKTGKTTYMKFVVLYPPADGATWLLRIAINAMANNPCSPTSTWFGKIDFRGTFTVNLLECWAQFQGHIDAFPAFEAYAAVNDGAGKPLFKEPPLKGNTVMNLPGAANRPIISLISL